MDADGLQLLVCLITAHLTADFLLQTENDVHHKHTFPVLIKHSSIHALLAYLLTGVLSWWQIPVSILISHALIDHTKARTNGKSVLVFLVDQFAHTLVLVLLAFLLPRLHPGTVPLWNLWFGSMYYKFLLLIAGLILVTRFGGILIGIAAAPYLNQLQNARKGESDHGETIDPLARGFDNGGFAIGQLERTLIFLLVIVNQASSIAILIAAKSIFRFGEIRDRENRMEAEYILIGTLMSFLFAVIISYMVRAILPLL